MKTIWSFTKIAAIAVVVVFSTVSCSKEAESPGPIDVSNDMTPGLVASSGYVTWEVEVENEGGEVEIEKVIVREEFISGWAQGMGTFEDEFAVDVSSIDAHESELIIDINTPVVNTGPTDVMVKNTVTVYTDGGTESDEVIYTITCDKKKSGQKELTTLLGTK